ncbi:hypothetical protein HC248_01158 [Polaromonas vacuolata]|uniref:DUF883 domain-containing protein n=1 Tax=Polaromonas vacuolata TaxID=37448 RepID=A0A6H2H8F4_9BURK|nr:hypothetical protein [Polaromonas vacuolata]QJC55874.1 hypothetical protein HC248_01158 [Polaromonas vacuolata]
MEKPFAKDEQNTSSEKASTNGSQNTANAVHQRVESASAALHGGVDKLAEPARHAVDRLSGAAHQTIDKLSNGASHTADVFAERAQFVTQGPKRVLDEGTAWIQDKPLQAVGLALLLGLIVGRLTSR